MPLVGSSRHAIHVGSRCDGRAVQPSAPLVPCATGKPCCLAWPTAVECPSTTVIVEPGARHLETAAARDPRICPDDKTVPMRSVGSAPSVAAVIRRPSQSPMNYVYLTWIEMQREQAPHLGVIIVTFNSQDVIELILEDVKRAANERLGATSIVVVDNSSTDRTCERAERSGARVRRCKNIGYGAAINAGRDELPHAELLLVLNPDIRLDPSDIEALCAAALSPSVGAAVPRLVNEDGSLALSLRWEPGLTRTLGDALVGWRWRGRPSWTSEALLRDREYRDTRDVDWATGAVVISKASVHDKCGGWPEDYFMYSEETEYFRKVRGLDLKVRFVASAQASHSGGASGSSRELDALQVLNKIYYYRKFHGTILALAMAVLQVVALVVRCAADRRLLILVIRRLLVPSGRRSLVAHLGGQLGQV